MKGLIRKLDYTSGFTDFCVDYYYLSACVIRGNIFIMKEQVFLEAINFLGAEPGFPDCCLFPETKVKFVCPHLLAAHFSATSPV